MARIRQIEIKHFRGIQAFTWQPAPGLNCLIGPGDSGKSTVLDAIDLCLGARRNLALTDADFYRLDVETPIQVTITLGDLEDSLKSLETYGLYLRSFDATKGIVEDEPDNEGETVLTILLTVEGDLEPSWTLVSERAEAQGQSRNLAWADRIRLAPARIGVMADYHLGWRRGSVLNRVSEERADASAALAKAAREARAAFGSEAEQQLGETLQIVADTARELGIGLDGDLKALLDAHSVSFSGGTIALHDQAGVPLRGLGTGSTRLLTAGLQRRAAAQSSMILIDELEYGLEPHRIIRSLDSLGAKEANNPLQVFMTTHSPVAVRELSGDQLFVMRSSAAEHHALPAGTSDDAQGTIRCFPEAFLAHSVIVCEGASEVGFVRGLDQYRAENGSDAIAAQGTVLIDSGGGSADRPFRRATVFQQLGYRVAVLRDDDKKPDAEVEAAFVQAGGKVIAWRDGRALEDELFLSLSAQATSRLLDHAIELHGEDLINEHIRSSTGNDMDLDGARAEINNGGIGDDTRSLLGQAARAKRNSWFKTVTRMATVAHAIVGPDLAHSDQGFRALTDDLFEWVASGDG
ncbi:MAG TPA: AAA family ATPase [Gammaproteobacteria bacterium]|nr:AAA family ATPase [Gammaproteobacteria bacterium]